MSSHQKAITDRTFEFAIRIVKLCQVLNESSGVAETLSKQLIKSGTSIEAGASQFCKKHGSGSILLPTLLPKRAVRPALQNKINLHIWDAPNWSKCGNS